MINLISNVKHSACKLGLAAAIVLFAGTSLAKVPLVAKWGRFEQSFKSSVSYENPFQQCTLRVTFTSPTGETNSVFGFWDGGKIWRVRFSPNQPGRWTYRTACSDFANQRLNNQTGEFLCTSPLGKSRFAQHGPVQVSADQHHFEHVDGAPFFWLADAAWNAARLSTPRDWITYTQVRSGQNFSAIQWAPAFGVDAKQHSAFSGHSRILVDPEYFQRLDEKVEMMNRAGLLSVIAPLWGTEKGTNDLPEDQVALLIRYLNARWGAYDIAWLLTTDANRSARAMRIGREAFAEMRHAPVVVFPGELASGFDEFRNENWVDAFGFGLGQNMNNDSLEWLVSGPLGRESTNQPARPIINVLPPMENGLAAQSQERVSANDVRRIAWWSLLVTPPAGVSYGAQDVATWNMSKPEKLPVWQLSLFLPGAKQISYLGSLMNSTEWWNLHPAARSVANQPGRNSPRRYIAASESFAKNLSVIYVPEDRTLEVSLEALPPSPAIQWFNPRTGQKSAAVAVVGARSCQLPTPDPGDWILLMKSGK
jgi:hypothetical protein